MLIVFNQMIVLLIFTLIGYALSKTKKLNASHSQLLSVLCVYIFLPCKIFKSFSTGLNVEFLSQKYPNLIISAIILIFLILISYIFAKFLTKDAYEQGVCKYSMIIPNFGYVGYALAESIYGSDMLLNVIFFGMIISTYTYTEGYRLLTDAGKVSVKKLINPLIISLIIGGIFGIFNIKLPEVMNTVIDNGGACMSPAAMILAGIVISEFKITKILKDKKVYILSVLRLIIIPGLLGIILSLILDNPDIVKTTLLIYAMPCGMNAIIFPRLVGKDCSLGAGLFLVSGIASIITIPVILNIF